MKPAHAAYLLCLSVLLLLGIVSSLTPHPVTVNAQREASPTVATVAATGIPLSTPTATPGGFRATQPMDIDLITAAKRGDLEAVKRLLSQEANVYAHDASGVTALIAAAYGNQLEIVRLLIDAGADVNAKDNTIQSAYLISTADGYVELLRMTLKAGADVHSTDSYNGTGLIRAADRGHVEIIQELLKTDIKIDHVNRLGWTALLEAIILGNGGARHTEVVRLLVQAGANVNLADSRGITPLAHARQRGFKEIITILENAGAH